MRNPTLVVMLGVLFLAACGGGSDEPVQQLFKPSGTVQCAASQTTLVRLAAEVNALRSAGASVSASGCANDGAGQLTVCGGTNGDLFAVTVGGGSVPIALQLGFRPASDFPTVQAIACL